MTNLELLDDRRFIFGFMFGVSNKLDTQLDRALSSFDVTSKQWFLICIIDLFLEPPTLKEVAQEMGNSHQNVKQVALKLEKKGFLTMEDDIHDGRALRLKLTEKNYNFWANTQEESAAFIDTIFNGIDEETLTIVRNALQTIDNNLKNMAKK